MAEFYTALKQCKSCIVYDTLDYKVSEDTILAPDVLVVCGEIKKKYLDFPPALVIEILSPSTALRDRHTKYEIYELKGIKYYLIDDAALNAVEIYQLQANQYMLVDISDGSFLFEFDGDDCKALIDFKEIW